MEETNLKEASSGNVFRVFLKFTVPNVISFIAMSSTAVVDGMFVGKFVGDSALAAVNIVMPLFTLIFGVAIMLTIGGAVKVGKYLGENNSEKASAMFTKVMAAIGIISLIMTLVCGLFAKQAAEILGANEELLPMSEAYLRTLSLFFLFQTFEYALAVFTRVDGNPYLSSFAVIWGAAANIVLDYIFIVKLQMGVRGAALGTGAAFMTSVFFLLFHFFLKKGVLRPVRKSGGIKDIFSAAYNGSSELLSEFSAGFIAFLFNWIMITRIGTKGVEAFTVINYAIWISGMLCYAVGDSVVPLVSINFGARKPDRIKTIIRLALGSVAGVGITVFALLSFIPEKLVGLFLSESNKEAFEIALVFAGYIKWAFLFSGANIIFSAYFTAIHRPLESVLIAGSRGLILPVAFLWLLPALFGQLGIYAAIPLADITTMFLALFLWRKNKPAKRIARAGSL